MVFAFKKKSFLPPEMLTNMSSPSSFWSVATLFIKRRQINVTQTLHHAVHAFVAYPEKKNMQKIVRITYYTTTIIGMKIDFNKLTMVD